MHSAGLVQHLPAAYQYILLMGKSFSIIGQCAAKYAKPTRLCLLERCNSRALLWFYDLDTVNVPEPYRSIL